MIVDLSVVPLVALSNESKQVIATLLNPLTVIPSENGLPRDWRGLADLSNFPGEMMPSLATHPNPSARILTVWEEKCKNIMIKDFQAILEELDRWDIVDDTLELFERDAEKYSMLLQKSQSSAEVIANEIDQKVLTVDDLHRLKKGLENQYYDALLLYADEDVMFANEMVDKLEKLHNLKLCLKDRDLIGGALEHEALMILIAERCNRLIVIVSSNFLKSRENKFFLNYAQAVGIDKQQRKVIPCLYEKCQLPPQLKYMFILDYNRVGKMYDFWGRLRDSIQTPSVKNNANSVSDKLLLPERENHEYNAGKGDKKEVAKENIKFFEPVKAQETQRNDDKYKLESEDSLHDLRLDNLQNPKDSNKRHNNFLQRTMKKWTKKSENDKKDYVPITGTVSLPSLVGLDTLSTSTESVEKKQKTKFIHKCVKKVQLKKVLVKS